MAAAGILEDAAERALVGRLRRLALSEQLGRPRLDDLGRRGRQPEAGLGDDLAGLEVRMAGRQVEVGGAGGSHPPAPAPLPIAGGAGVSRKRASATTCPGSRFEWRYDRSSSPGPRVRTPRPS